MTDALLTVAYEGTCYRGFERQAKGEDTVRGRLEAVLAETLGRDVGIVAAGRTDAGVHAAAMPVLVPGPLALRPERLAHALNARLPKDIVVRAARAAPPGFQPRFDALGKTYVYNLWIEPSVPPFWRRYAWHRPRQLDLTLMEAAARALSGRHDFSAFGRTGRPTLDTVRDVRLRITRRGPLVTVWADGSGFLYKMVRALVGTVVEAGRGALSKEDVAAMVAGQRASGPTAPAHGLTLVEVRYAWGTVAGHDFIDLLPNDT